MQDLTATIISNFLAYKHANPLSKHPFIVGICGVPGSGKSTLAENVKTKINNLLAANGQESESSCLVLPQDGYHYPLEHLRAQRDSARLIYYRGSAETFNLRQYYQDMSLFKTKASAATYHFPGFDHAEGDPNHLEYLYMPGQHEIIIIEGLYIFNEIRLTPGMYGETHDLAELLDLKVFLEADVESCIQGLKQRNQSIPGYSVNEIIRRCDVVDRENARLVLKYKHKASVLASRNGSCRKSQ